MTKTDYRKTYRALAKELEESERRLRSHDLLCQIERLTEVREAKKIALYMSLNDEPDLFPLFQILENQGKEIYLPITRAEGEMDFYLYEGFDRLEGKEPYGILEPRAIEEHKAEPREVEVMIIPALAYTREGYRLGRGKGYYDRYLARVENCYTIGVSLGLLNYDLAPDEWDVPMDLVLIPKL